MPRPRMARARGQKRQSVWGFLTPGNNTLTATGGTIVASLNAAALARRPFTIVRTHLEFMLRSDQSAAIEQQTCAFGMAVVSDEAVAAGVASVPTPITELGSDLWFLHVIMFGDESKLTDRSSPATLRSVDSKAMRKVEEGQDIVFVAELGGTGAGLILSSGGRFLIKTH